MLLCNARLWREEGLQDIVAGNGSVLAIQEAGVFSKPVPDVVTADLDGALVLPGFINSHDHLDFNNYPALAHGNYPDYRAWGADIHRRYASVISAVKQIPQELRIRWGLYKNLLNGFTTVVNHGEQLDIKFTPVAVVQDTYILHSPGFEKNWRWKLNHPFRTKKTCVIHAGEGTSAVAEKELNDLARSNYLKRPVVVVHGVAMKPAQAGSFKGLVWCPASNYFLLGQTAAIQDLRDKIPVVFGTDSTLSASWDAWRHFRIAQWSGEADDDVLMQMLTSAPASLWSLNDRGTIAPGKRADLLVLDPGSTDASLFSGNASMIRMVVTEGKIRMLDEGMLEKLQGFSTAGFTRIVLQGRVKWVEGDLVALVRGIRQYYPDAEIPFRFT